MLKPYILFEGAAAIGYTRDETILGENELKNFRTS